MPKIGSGAVVYYTKWCHKGWQLLIMPPTILVGCGDPLLHSYRDCGGWRVNDWRYSQAVQSDLHFLGNVHQHMNQESVKRWSIWILPWSQWLMMRRSSRATELEAEMVKDSTSHTRGTIDLVKQCSFTPYNEQTKHIREIVAFNKEDYNSPTTCGMHQGVHRELVIGN